MTTREDREHAVRSAQLHSPTPTQQAWIDTGDSRGGLAVSGWILAIADEMKAHREAAVAAAYDDMVGRVSAAAADPQSAVGKAVIVALEAAVAAERERVAKMGILADSDALATVIGGLENYTLNGSNAPAQIRGIYADLENATKLIRAERERTRVLAKEWREKADELDAMDAKVWARQFRGDKQVLRECADALEGEP